MKNDVTDKSIMRRYLDDMYTQEEAWSVKNIRKKPDGY